MGIGKRRLHPSYGADLQCSNEFLPPFCGGRSGRGQTPSLALPHVGGENPLARKKRVRLAIAFRTPWPEAIGSTDVRISAWPEAPATL